MTVANEPGQAGIPAQRSRAIPDPNARPPGGQRSGGPGQARQVEPVLVVTTDTLPGFHVLQVLGDVLGVLARPRNPYSEGVKALSGKPVAADASAAALMRWRQDAIARMAQQARERGANAVIGLRFDHRDVTGAWGEICAYGTAVLVEPIYDRDQRMYGAFWAS